MERLSGGWRLAGSPPAPRPPPGPPEAPPELGSCPPPVPATPSASPSDRSLHSRSWHLRSPGPGRQGGGQGGRGVKAAPHPASPSVGAGLPGLSPRGRGEAAPPPPGGRRTWSARPSVNRRSNIQVRGPSSWGCVSLASPGASCWVSSEDPSFPLCPLQARPVPPGPLPRGLSS